MRGDKCQFVQIDRDINDWKCSFCEHTWIMPYYRTPFKLGLNYCPNCGSYIYRVLEEIEPDKEGAPKAYKIIKNQKGEWKNMLITGKTYNGFEAAKAFTSPVERAINIINIRISRNQETELKKLSTCSGLTEEDLKKELPKDEFKICGDLIIKKECIKCI